MTQKNLQTNIELSLANLLKLAEISCWNKISNNYLFIFSEIKDSDFQYHKKGGGNTNKRSGLLDLNLVTEMLEKEYADLYDINFYIFKAKKFHTIIEIQYYRKSSLDKEFFETIKDNQPMFHSKIAMPMYAKDGKKFDINWKSGGFIHSCKMFIYNFKYRKRIKMYSKEHY